MALKLDYSLETPEERTKYIEELIKTLPPEQLTPKYLTYFGDYIIFAMDKQERKTKKILTDNRLTTINKRETSFEGLVGKLENGEDGIYGMLENNKNILLTSKATITPKDIAEIPELQNLRKEIENIEKQILTASGRRKFLLKKQLIEMRQEQYVIKDCFKKTMYCGSPGSGGATPDFTGFDDNITVNPDGTLTNTALIDLFNPKHISALLCDYSRLKQDAWGKFNGDMFYLMLDLDHLVEVALKDEFPLYYDLLIYKIDGKTNEEIQDLLYQDYQIKHTVEYISSLWRNKIPKMIAETAVDEYLDWHYTEKERGKWKRCSRCGQLKLAHNRFFSKNNTSKDGFYSICKKCRNAKNKEKKEGK